ncbi:uncharacterized protein PAC_03302 [Phialocephala subalpina]|uniref:Polyketide synthase n=1 Tax=Phialocephala subalpina TaxID=576137 RepID=A0A1L7WKX0_9HELO|nr:uncharacterized protein PAC_03302 [Phialocephala subalpina]
MGDSREDELPDISKDVAIIGMSGRFPSAGSVPELWQIIEDGRDVHQTIPKDRFDMTELLPNQLARFGCFIDKPASFDARLFNMSPREALQTDPIHRILLMATYEALEIAGYSGHRGQRIGTFFGQATDDWRESNASQDVDVHYIPATQRAFGPGRLNYHFKWDGPSYSIDTACSSSATTIEMAYKAIINEDVNVAIAGGGNIITGHQMYAGLSKGGFLSKSGSCKAFDSEADGYCRGEAVGVVVLKSLGDAIRDNDSIRGIIKSVESNHSAHAISITHPHSGAQQELYRRTLQKGMIDPSDVSYVEMHGTGTQAGDSVEGHSVTEFFGDRAIDNPLYVGSVKSNIGHGEAAAGISSVIKSLLMFQNNLIPPHCGIKTTLNATLTAALQKNIRIARQKERFQTEKKRILVNNFNATGGNTCILLEEPSPRPTSTVEDPRSHLVITVSGHTSTSFKGNRARIIQYLEKHPAVSLADLSYSTSRRIHNSIRSAYSARTIEDLLTDMKTSKRGGISREKRPVIFLFPGQGSQFVGMGKVLFNTCPPFRQSLQTLNDICQKQFQVSFLDLVTSDEDLASFQPVQIHLAIVSVELALANLWKSWGLIPQAVIGHSLGEFAALCVADVLSVSDCLRLVATRARLLQAKCEPGTHGMLAIQGDLSIVKQVLERKVFGTCAVACLNGPLSTVVSGEIHEIERLKSALGSESVQTKILGVPFAFHSAQIDPILDEFEKCAVSVEFKAPNIAVASSTGTLVTTKGVFGPEFLRQQTRNAVDFAGALQACETLGPASDTIWVECGAGSSLLAMAKATVGSLPSQSITSILHNVSEWKTTTEGLAKAYASGIDVQWQEFHRPFEQSLRLFELPTYSFDCKDYWIQNSLTSSSPKKVRGGERPSFSSSSFARLEDKSHETTTHVFSTTESTLLAAIQGHLVEDVGLCPSSVYLDMALTAASNLLPKIYLARGVAVEISDMKIFSPLVVTPGTLEPDIKITASSSADTDRVLINFSSILGPTTQEHATCSVLSLDSNDCRHLLRTTAYLVHARMKSLIDPNGKAHYLQRKMIYRLFSTIVAYSKPYQNITDLYLDTELNEAVATIEFPRSTSDQKPLYTPYWTDAIVHLAGFVLNGNLAVNDDIIYISSGWKGLRIIRELQANVSYQAYARMYSDGDNGLFLGDVYLFYKDEVIVTCTSLQFQRMSRRTLRTILGLDSRSPAVHQPAPKSAPGVEKPKEVAGYSALAAVGDFRQIIADETGYPVETLVDELSIHDLGIDSLISNAIVSRIGRETGLKLSTSAFASCSTIGELNRHLQDQAQSECAKKESSSSSGGTDQSPLATPTSSTEAKEKLRSNSVFIQGDHNSGLPILFLIADGAGSAASYTKFSTFELNLPVYGLESPFLNAPLEFTISFEEVVSTFVDEIRKLQPHGPYLLGGWSMGGMFAYEIARQLLNMREQVLGLILIDSPCPRPIDKLADISMELLEKTGIFDDANHTGKGVEAKMSLNTRQHLLASVRALGAYEPVAMHPERRPQNVSLIWARHGLFERLSEKIAAAIGKANASSQDTIQLNDMHEWFTAPRVDFRANGWDRLLGEDVEYHALEGDHFSIMNPPQRLPTSLSQNYKLINRKTRTKTSYYIKRVGRAGAEYSLSQSSLLGLTSFSAILSRFSQISSGAATSFNSVTMPRSSDGRDILMLLMPMLPNGKDDYGSSIEPPLPLDFREILEGKPLSSNTCRLFQLPFEILSDIMRCIDHESLANLAPVNSDSRQLARSMQFVSVVLDYSEESRSLISILLKESEERIARGNTRQPSISACIRRMTIRTNPYHLSNRHQIEISDEFMNLDEQTQAARQEDACRSYYDTYLRDIALLLANPKSLPYLDLLNWQDASPLPPLLLDNLTNTRFQHLRLNRVPVTGYHEIKPSVTGSAWPLRSLILSMKPIFKLLKTGLTAKQGISILQQYIASVPYTDESVIRDFLQSPLETLVIATRSKNYVENCMAERGCISTLRTFVCKTRRPGSATFKFLRANPQISTLCFPYWLSEEIVNQELLPMLSSSFDRLTSLSISWEQEKTPIDNTALGFIGTLKSLEQVHFAAGQEGGRQDWLVDHKNMRHWLAQLPKLRKVAFSRDSYTPLNPRFNSAEFIEFYYEDRYPDLRYSGGPFQPHDREERYRVWEEQHQGRILHEAQKYVEILPKLEWIYFGQLPMRVVGESREVVTLAERDSCHTLLKNMFGCEL